MERRVFIKPIDVKFILRYQQEERKANVCKHSSRRATPTFSVVAVHIGNVYTKLYLDFSSQLDNMALTRKSEYFNTLSTTSKKRYETKVTTTRLKVDPYAIADNLWTREPETIPPLSWSDVMIYIWYQHQAPIPRKLSR